MLWRPVFAKLASFEEVSERWTIDTLFDAHELLDIREELEARQAAAIRGQ